MGYMVNKSMLTEVILSMQGISRMGRYDIYFNV